LPAPRRSLKVEAFISQLEAATHSPDPAQHTEMATLQRINQALLIELRTQQETNQMLQIQALQQMVGQKVQQDNLKSLFLLGNGYQQTFNSVTPQQTTAGTQWAFHY
jgi:predicted ATPase